MNGIVALVVLSVCTCAAMSAAAQQRSPTAHCYDGTYYYGTSHREACAHHRGVSEWLGATSRAELRSAARHPAARARHPVTRPGSPRVARAPKGATAHCRDGTWTTQARRAGACAGHGGVLRWIGPH